MRLFAARKSRVCSNSARPQFVAALIGATGLLAAIWLLLFPHPVLHAQQTGLVAAFSFDEGSGTTVNDLSGSGNHGTLAGPVWTGTSKRGGALTFDGINDIVTINDSATLDLTTGMTLEAWVRPTSVTGWRTIMLKEVPNELGYALYANGDTNRPSAWLRVGGTSRSAIGPTRLTANTWTHLAATYDNAVLRLYLNGAQVRTTALAGAIQTSTNPLRIGGNSVWGEYFAGQIDEIRIYNRALTAAEIVTDMNTPVTATPDVTAPTVVLTAPTEGAAVSGTAVLSATASDNLSVSGVTFLVDGVAAAAEDTLAPYSLNWASTTVANGTHSITARARDAAGNTATSPSVLVSVNNPPRLTITQPANGANLAASTVAVSYVWSGDPTGVDHVHFILDGGAEVMDMTLDGSYTYNNVAPGSHVLNGFLVRADHTKIAGSYAAPVTFSTTAADNTPTTITLTAPANGALVSGSVTVSATATDNVQVVGVQFFLDGGALGSEDTAAPYQISWSTLSTSDGGHSLTARARDAAGSTTTSEAVPVTVMNTPGPAVTGQWSQPFSMPVVAIHQSLLPNGRVMLWDAADFNALGPVVWDPATGGFTNAPINSTDLFCAGHVLLTDGRLLTFGGDTRTNGLGVWDTNSYNSTTNLWTALPRMAYKRWYPTAVTLPDNRVFVMSGYDDCYAASCLVATPELFDPRTSTWTSLPAANSATPSYPFLFVMPDGRLLHAGSYEGTLDTRILTPGTWTWSVVDPTPIDAGSAVMYLPGKIMKSGKWANSDAPYRPAHPNTYVLDMSQSATASWRQTAPMNFPRAYNVTTLLPDGSVLATGGSLSTDPGNASLGVLEAEIWSPQTETWTPMGRMRNARLYHNSAMLLPDGRVLVAGSGRYGSPEQLNGEIFSPPYLFKGPRPQITSAPSVIPPASTFVVTTPNADVTAVNLVRVGAMTHSFNSDQRFIPLSFTVDGGSLNVTAPENLNIAPPGYYLLFLINSAGVPSVGSFLRVPAAAEDSVAPGSPSTVFAVPQTNGVALSWSPATDNVGVVGYDVHRSTAAGFVPSAGTLIAQAATTAHLDQGLAAGTYYYRVLAYDGAGNRSLPSPEVSATIALVDATPPTVTLTAPAAGSTVSGTVTLTATAADNVGVAGVTFTVDGTAIATEDTTAPYSGAWNTAAASAGTHVLRAIARDSSNNTTTSDAVSVTVNPAPPASGLVLALGFNEGAGTQATDASGNGNTGTVLGATWTAGRYGNALQFNGSSNRVTVADAAALDLTDRMTVSAWVRPTAINADYRTIVLKERPAGLTYALYAADGANRPPAGYITVGGTDRSVVSNGNLPLNTWTHVALTYDGATLRIWINGVQTATRANTGNAMVSTGVLSIGGNAVWGEYFAGAIDEVRIYNRALTATEIQAEMAAPVP